ncbi:MAG: cellulase family glycosylhydrolase [Oscillospiraceae bacterium]|nr:cellulase family glycosylhydrolase [Oscillospiraceae bacterium]
MYVKGVNLGNWLVLEKWMNPFLFAGTTAEDEYWLARDLDPAVYEARIRIHRSEYITERDFVTIRSWGLDTVRIPVPFGIFGDRPPYIGCIEELDRAFNWAEKYGLKILIDLHTVPYSASGSDNSGLCGVCAWASKPEEVEFTLTVLERLAQRYGQRDGLFGIELVNEPVVQEMSNIFDIANRYPPRDPEMAKMNAYPTLDWLKQFYLTGYERLTPHLAEGKYVVIHDAFMLTAWKDFMQEEKYRRNVILDTHQYLMMAEMFGCSQDPDSYVKFIQDNFAAQVAEMQQYFNVICGEWCLFNSYCCGVDTKGGQSVLNGVAGAETETVSPEEKRRVYRMVAKAQLDAWKNGCGYFYWSYKLLTDTVNTPGWLGWDCWDLGRCVDFGWFPRENAEA